MKPNLPKNAAVLHEGSSKKILRLPSWSPPVIIFVAIIVIWVVFIELFKIPTYLLPSPKQIVLEMIRNLPMFLKNGQWTMIEAVSGFILGGGFGFLLGVFLTISKFWEKGCLPYIIASTTVPIVAFAPLVVVYVGFGIQAKIVIAAIVSFFPLCLYTQKGLMSTDLVQRDLFYSLAASRKDQFFKLQLPTSLPYVLTAMKQTSTVAVVSAIIAEYIQADRGFGYLILSSSYQMNIPRLWASIIFSSIMAITFYVIVVIIEKRLLSWHSSMVDQK